MQPILDLPMRTDDLQQAFRTGFLRRQAGDATS
jgi:hypothetical protein